MYQFIPLLGQVGHNAAICLYFTYNNKENIQNRSWHENIEKGFLYHIKEYSLIIIITYLKSEMSKVCQRALVSPNVSTAKF